MKIANLGIGTRLWSGFALVLALLACVAMLGIDGMSRSNANLHHIVDVNSLKISLLEDMSKSVHIVSRVVRTMALLADEEEARNQHKKIDAAWEKYNKASATLEKMPLDDAGKAFVAIIGQDQAIARTLNDKFVALSRTDRERAISLLMKEAIPASATLQDAIEEFIDLQKRKTRNDEISTEEIYHRAMTLMLALTGLALAAGVLIAWISTR